MEKFIWSIATALVIVATVVAIGFIFMSLPVRADNERWMLVKFYAKTYSQETACMLDLEQAAQMSPAGTRFKCERIPK